MRLKASAHSVKTVALATFQFHSGAVKGRGTGLNPRYRFTRFNSTLVRLKGVFFVVSALVMSGFNSTLVRLKGACMCRVC